MLNKWKSLLVPLLATDVFSHGQLVLWPLEVFSTQCFCHAPSKGDVGCLTLYFSSQLLAVSAEKSWCCLRYLTGLTPRPFSYLTSSSILWANMSALILHIPEFILLSNSWQHPLRKGVDVNPDLHQSRMTQHLQLSLSLIIVHLCPGLLCKHVVLVGQPSLHRFCRCFCCLGEQFTCPTITMNVFIHWLYAELPSAHTRYWEINIPLHYTAPIITVFMTMTFPVVTFIEIGVKW